LKQYNRDLRLNYFPTYYSFLAFQFDLLTSSLSMHKLRYVFWIKCFWWVSLSPSISQSCIHYIFIFWSATHGFSYFGQWRIDNLWENFWMNQTDGNHSLSLSNCCLVHSKMSWKIRQCPVTKIWNVEHAWLKDL